MSTEAITEKIAEYFKTQPVLKAWLFGSFARLMWTYLWNTIRMHVFPCLPSRT